LAFCSECGNTVQEGDTFCDNCGFDLRSEGTKIKIPKAKAKIKEGPEIEIKETFIEEEEKEIIRRRKVPVFISKTLPSKCPSCGSPFEGKSGDKCEYCGSIIRTEEKVGRVV